MCALVMVDAADMAAVVKNREEDAERLSEEVTENRDDLNRMLDSFRHRERQLLDDIETLKHKNVTVSDLLDLVTERAESTQKELDRCRAGDVATDTTASAPSTDVTLQKEWEVNKVSILAGVVRFLEKTKFVTPNFRLISRRYYRLAGWCAYAHQQSSAIRFSTSRRVIYLFIIKLVHKHTTLYM